MRTVTALFTALACAASAQVPPPQFVLMPQRANRYTHLFSGSQSNNYTNFIVAVNTNQIEIPVEPSKTNYAVAYTVLPSGAKSGPSPVLVWVPNGNVELLSWSPPTLTNHITVGFALRSYNSLTAGAPRLVVTQTNFITLTNPTDAELFFDVQATVTNAP